MYRKKELFVLIQAGFSSTVYFFFNQNIETLINNNPSQCVNRSYKIDHLVGFTLALYLYLDFL